MLGRICVVGMGHVGLAFVPPSDEAGPDIVDRDIDDRGIRRPEAGTDPIDEVDDLLRVEFDTDPTALGRDRPRTSDLSIHERS